MSRTKQPTGDEQYQPQDIDWAMWAVVAPVLVIGVVASSAAAYYVADLTAPRLARTAAMSAAMLTTYIAIRLAIAVRKGEKSETQAFLDKRAAAERNEEPGDDI